MEKTKLPDGGKYRIENFKSNKIRIFYNQKVNGFRLRDTVVKAPANLSELTEEGITNIVNSMIHHDKEVACPFCEEVTPMSQMRGYGHAGSVCQLCWNNCVCRQCGTDDWELKSSRSTRQHSKKKCSHCGKEFITSVATG